MKKLALTCSFVITFCMFVGSGNVAEAAAQIVNYGSSGYSSGAARYSQSQSYRPTGAIMTSGVNYIDREIGTGRIRQVVSVSTPVAYPSYRRGGCCNHGYGYMY